MSDLIAEPPGSCTCTWELTADDPRWRRIGDPKEDCPACTGDEPLDDLPEWLDDNRGP